MMMITMMISRSWKMINFQSYVRLPEGSRRTISDYRSWILDIIGYACLFVLKQMSGESQGKKTREISLGIFSTGHTLRTLLSKRTNNFLNAHLKQQCILFCSIWFFGVRRFCSKSGVGQKNNPLWTRPVIFSGVRWLKWLDPCGLPGPLERTYLTHMTHPLTLQVLTIWYFLCEDFWHISTCLIVHPSFIH